MGQQKKILSKGVVTYISTPLQRTEDCEMGWSKTEEGRKGREERKMAGGRGIVPLTAMLCFCILFLNDGD